MLLHWDDLEPRASSASVTKRHLQGQAASLVQVAVKAGTKAERHSHSFEQFVQVIVGRGLLETAEGTKPFAAGSLFHFPPGAWHAAIFEDDTILVETNLAAA
jgi:quercetin dioxygenase-like cupin family protein